MAIQSLLDTPRETLGRPRREQIMKRLVSQLPWEQSKKEEPRPDYWRRVLSLMVKLMDTPTFYDVCIMFWLEIPNHSNTVTGDVI